jgi:hypothetical protein
MEVENRAHFIIWSKKLFIMINMINLKEEILSSFSFLEKEYNYSVIFKEIENSVFLESFEFEYSNEILRREITLSYSKGLVDDIIRHTFALTIVRLPYVGVGDFFVLDNYLKFKGIKTISNIDNELEIYKVRTVLNEIANLIKSNVLEVINGECWYEKFYPKVD